LRCVIFLSGDIKEDGAVRAILGTAGFVICADGGVRHARRLDARPDLLVGDLDSVSEEDLAWIESRQVPVCRFSPVKDETDAELAILEAMARCKGSPGLHEIILAGAFGSRPDHVLATQFLAARFAAAGWRFILTDGRSSLYTLSGGQSLTFDLPVYADCPLAVSAVPVTASISGLTYEGLLYPLADVSLNMGSTRGVSNRVAGRPVRIILDAGVLFIVVTPED
jgi:thiamine pyrophosphokinase